MFDNYLIIILAPLIGSIIAGFSGRMLGNGATAIITILGVVISFVLSLQVFANQVLFEYPSFNENVYTWLQIANFNLSVGFLIDELTSIMMLLVTFVSLMVHIYSIGYMKGEVHFTRFFSYISLFTFSMLMLVMSNNFMQLFFGWEAVGLVSYLLIGFYYTKDSAVSASLKAFLVNRVGDFGFVIGIALIFANFGTLDYAEVFAKLHFIESKYLFDFELITIITFLLFVGAMGKSAQMPLHIWLAGSMEGPTPISALIHAATMVTAGIFMVSRLSPMFELSGDTLTFIMFVGAFTAFFMGLIGLVQTDIKKVIAYSTLSQLGYMTVALGVSAYPVAIFHLFTHGFFKALLFLAAGSVIVAHHHNQDIFKMGGLRKKMPITFITFVIGTLALIGFPGFAGFYSKDMIIEAVHLSSNSTDIIYYMVLGGVFVTALYSMRLLFLVFYGRPKDEKLYAHAKESPFSITLPLMLLAIPSIIIGAIAIEPLLFNGMFDKIFAGVVGETTTMGRLSEHFVGVIGMISHSIHTTAFWFMFAGILVAWIMYVYKPNLATFAYTKLSIPRKILENLYGFDRFNDIVFVKGSLLIAKILNWIDSVLIDKIIVDGTAKSSKVLGKILRIGQTGYVYHYSFFMIIALAFALLWVLFRMEVL